MLVVPSRGAVVAIGAPSPPPSALLDDVHVVTVDTNGCTQQVTALAPAPPTRDGANAQLLPPGATSIGLCRYLNGWMVRSAMVTGSTLGSFEAGVNSSPSRPQGPVGGTCADGESIVLHASYASGPPVQLLAELSGCPYSLSNGAITHGLSRALVTALIDPVGWSGSLGDLTQLPPA